MGTQISPCRSCWVHLALYRLRECDLKEDAPLNHTPAGAIRPGVARMTCREVWVAIAGPFGRPTTQVSKSATRAGSG